MKYRTTIEFDSETRMLLMILKERLHHEGKIASKNLNDTIKYLIKCHEEKSAGS